MASKTQPGRLQVGVVGSGRVGPVLARALAGAGHSIVGITASSDEARERVAAILPGVPVLPLDEVVRASELVLFAVPGEQLPGLVQGLSALGVWQPGQIVAHTAPERGFSVFAPAAAQGVIPLAMHPAMVFTGTSIDLGRLAESTIAVSAPAPVLPIAQALAVEMGGEPVVVADADRASYTDALAAARDLSASVARQAVDKLENLGLTEPARLVASTVYAAIAEALRVAAPDIWQPDFAGPGSDSDFGSVFDSGSDSAPGSTFDSGSGSDSSFDSTSGSASESDPA
ncbi:MAG: DUF2520 domain-containing protein [Microbacteriaceae bacterium]|nr:DUF2520 domain-containing protein [Microbacteriaceae bacterium]